MTVEKNSDIKENQVISIVHWVDKHDSDEREEIAISVRIDAGIPKEYKRLMQKGEDGCCAYSVYMGLCHLMGSMSKRTGLFVHLDGSPMTLADLQGDVRVDFSVFNRSIALLKQEGLIAVTNYSKPKI